MTQQIYGFLYLFSLLLFTSCSPKYTKYISNYHFNNSITSPDYSNLNYWASNPDKKSLSDSIPQPLRQSFIKDTTTDIFFLHPTTFGSKDDSRWNADINDSVVNAKTDYTTILYQASTFNESRIFAPRYRQAHLRAYYTDDTVAAKQAFNLAYGDLKTAFQYYLDHYNHGRPVIIASHSQGTTHAIRLLKEFFDGKPLAGKLVAAYIIGMAIPKNYFSNLHPCKDSAQTGCLIGWRTYKEGYEPEFVQKEQGNSYVVNPLIWTTENTYAPRDANKGGVVTTFKKVAPKVTDAKIHDDIIWTHHPHFPGSFLFIRKNYHIGDINLFYVNIRENVRTRILQYGKTRK